MRSEESLLCMFMSIRVLISSPTFLQCSHTTYRTKRTEQNTNPQYRTAPMLLLFLDDESKYSGAVFIHLFSKSPVTKHPFIIHGRPFFIHGNIGQTAFFIHTFFPFFALRLYSKENKFFIVFIVLFSLLFKFCCWNFFSSYTIKFIYFLAFFAG